MSPAEDDLTARARIREAAVHRFAAHGLDASLRSIAADAGVSAGLILHHFGSRAGLREACDEHVLKEIREFKTAVLRSDAGTAAVLMQIAEVEGYAMLVGYVLRALQSGGDLTDRFIDAVTASSEKYMEDAVRDGIARPSRDPAARARALTVMSLGALTLDLPARHAHWDLDELPAMLRGYTERMVLPLLELYTEPLLTDSSLLDAYLDSPDGARATAHATHGPGPSAPSADTDPGADPHTDTDLPTHDRSTA